MKKLAVFVVVVFLYIFFYQPLSREDDNDRDDSDDEGYTKLNDTMAECWLSDVLSSL